MSYRDQVVARFGLRVVVPAVAVLVGALVIVVISLGRDGRRGQPHRGPAHRTLGGGRGAGHDPPARGDAPRLRRWDDAVRNATARSIRTFMAETFSTSTIDAVFFDTAILLDEVGGVRFAVHKGEALRGRRPRRSTAAPFPP